MGVILGVISMIKPALEIIEQFSGNAALAKTTDYVQDAIGVVTALTPLVQQFGAGKEVTAEDVRVALANDDAALKQFDELIAQKSVAGPGT